MKVYFYNKSAKYLMPILSHKYAILINKTIIMSTVYSYKQHIKH